MMQPARSRRVTRQAQQRQRREWRDQLRELQDRTQRQAIPRRDDGPPPRID